MTLRFSSPHQSIGLHQKYIDDIHKEWFKDYKKNNPEQPFKVLDSMNRVIDYFLKDEKSFVVYIVKDESEKIGWMNYKIVGEITQRPFQIGHLNYLFLEKTIQLKPTQYQELRLTRKGEKIYSIFLNHHLKRVYEKDLVYFPFFWILMEESQKTIQRLLKERGDSKKPLIYKPYGIQ